MIRASAAASGPSIGPTCTASCRVVRRPARDTDVAANSSTVLPGIELLRSLAEYEQAAGGGW